MKSKMAKCKQCDNYIVVSGVECVEVCGEIYCNRALQTMNGVSKIVNVICSVLAPPSVRSGFAQEVYGGMSARM